MLDTNIVLDAFLFGDPAARPLHDGLVAGQLHWLATAAMREELQRVLDYPQLVPWLANTRVAPHDVLAAFDRYAQPLPAAPRAPLCCRDPDDQMFIDLAVQQRCTLLSKDRAVLALARRLAQLGVHAAPALGRAGGDQPPKASLNQSVDGTSRA
ncbi:putative toxin-antitoxin system toxin component, PIN family [Ramlibacter tataouinensis]|uniref:putative toxin-antitoxin system toxin component, PIN family n=1 Tax=Ramlibacter tataouinensis TaxID=94132 RepID=UPI00300E3EF0